MTPLRWGRKYLMCPPDEFAVLYEINPWMHREIGVDADRSRAQWEGLRALLAEAGAAIDTIEPVEGLPDMVFTANAGVVDGQRFVVSRFRHPQRSPEAEHFARWFGARRFELSEIPAGLHLEGAGDALPFRGRLLAGYRFRSDFPAHTLLASTLGVEVLSIELVDPRFYHLDLTFCPLDGRRAMVVPDAWDRYGWEVVANLVPEPVVLSLDEALAFCANSVVVGSTVIMSACSPRLERELKALAFEVAVSPVDEFLKAGGGVRCLTLATDVSLAAV